MAKSQNDQLLVVFIVSCYQNIVGVYACAEDAYQIQKEYVAKNRPADVLVRSVFYPQIS